MDCHEGNIVVEAGKDCTNIVLDKITACGRQQVRTTLHSLGESVTRHAHTDGSHFCDHINRVEEFVAPCVHALLPVIESLWNDLWNIVSGSNRTFTNLPKESPLVVKDWFKWGDWGIFLGQLFSLDELGVVSSFLDEFGSGSDLIEHFRFNVWNFLFIVEFVPCLLEVVFHQVHIVIIVLEVDARVLDQKNPEIVEALSDFLAFDLHVLRQILHLPHIQVHSHVNYWHFSEFS